MGRCNRDTNRSSRRRSCTSALASDGGNGGKDARPGSSGWTPGTAAAPRASRYTELCPNGPIKSFSEPSSTRHVWCGRRCVASSRATTCCPTCWWAHRSTSGRRRRDRKSTRLNSSHANISYVVFCLKQKKYYCQWWKKLCIVFVNTVFDI